MEKILEFFKKDKIEKTSFGDIKIDFEKNKKIYRLRIANRRCTISDGGDIFLVMPIDMFAELLPVIYKKI